MIASASTWFQALLVGVGAAVGATVRWRVGLWVAHVQGWGFPMGSLLVNVAGGLGVGMMLAWLARMPNTESEPLRLLLVTGFLGGLTTFSAFSAESLLLIQRHQFSTALVHTSLHVLGALVAAIIGWSLLHRG